MDRMLSLAQVLCPPDRRLQRAAYARGRRNDDSRAARDEYAAIERLREVNWIAAHIRERRYELELTQRQVAERAGTSRSFISKLERGTHIPTIPVVTSIFATLEERLLIGIERDTPDGGPEREIAAVPSASPHDRLDGDARGR